MIKNKYIKINNKFLKKNLASLYTRKKRKKKNGKRKKDRMKGGLFIDFISPVFDAIRGVTKGAAKLAIMNEKRKQKGKGFPQYWMQRVKAAKKKLNK